MRGWEGGGGEVGAVGFDGVVEMLGEGVVDDADLRDLRCGRGLTVRFLVFCGNGDGIRMGAGLVGGARGARRDVPGQ